MKSLKPELRSIVFCCSLILICASAVSAQTNQATWDQANVATATQAQGFVYKLYITPPGATQPNTPATLTTVLCGGQPPTVQCSSVLSSQAAAAATVTGAKSQLTATDTTSGVESALSNPFSKPAAVPGNLKITP